MGSIPRRTATHIRTMTTAPLNHGSSPRRKYTRLARLAFEREHRDKDIQAARKRIEDGATRVAEIRREEARLLASIDASRRGKPCPAQPHAGQTTQNARSQGPGARGQGRGEGF
jgi:hypothetical protein